MKNRILISLLACILCSTFLLILLSILVFPKPLVKLYINYLEKKLNTHIEFSCKQIAFFKEWHFADVRISSRSGYTLGTEDIILYPSFSSLRKGEIDISCKAQNLRFYKEVPLLNAVCSLLSIQPLQNIGFDKIDVTIAVRQDKIKMHNLRAVSKDIEIFGSGITDTKTKAIDYNLKFLFSKSITSNIPEVIKLTLLNEESDLWMGLNLNVKGDYRKPSLRLKSDLLDLFLSNK